MCLLCACPQTENEHLKASVARLSAALAEKDRAAAAQAATLVAPGHPQGRPGPGDTLSPKAPTKGGGREGVPWPHGKRPRMVPSEIPIIRGALSLH